MSPVVWYIVEDPKQVNHGIMGICVGQELLNLKPNTG